MEKIKNMFKKEKERFTNLCKGKNLIFPLGITLFFIVLIGCIVFNKHNNYISDFLMILFMYILSISILLFFNFYYLFLFDVLVNFILIVIYVFNFIEIDSLFIIYFCFKFFITIVLFIVPNDNFKSWCEDFSKGKLYLFGIIVSNLILLLILVILEYKDISIFLFLELILFCVLIIYKFLKCSFYRLKFFDFLLNIFFTGIIGVCFYNRDIKYCLLSFFYYYLIRLILLILLLFLNMNYIDKKLKHRKLNYKNYKVNYWLKKNCDENLLQLKKFKDINLSFGISEGIARENRCKSKYLERKILLKFNNKNELKREVFILNKVPNTFFYGLLCSVITLVLTDFFAEKSKIIVIIKFLWNTMKYLKNYLDVTKLESIINLIKNMNNYIEKYYMTFYAIYIAIIFIIIMIFYIINYIKSYQNRKVYINLLNYIIDNYDEFYKEYNIKQICIKMELDEDKNFTVIKKYLKYALLNYNEILRLDEFKIEEFKNFLQFLNNNGIDIYIYSKDAKESSIKKYIKDNALNDLECNILGKKDIECILDKEKIDFIIEFCKMLYISSNECFILVDSDDKNIYYEINSLENDKILKYKEPFYDLTEMLEFLQSKME